MLLVRGLVQIGPTQYEQFTLVLESLPESAHIQVKQSTL
jgi:hypothetical protein